MDASLKDIRFGTSNNGGTLLPYFIESGANTAATKIWIKIPSLPANETKLFFMFHGNSSAISESTLSTFDGDSRENRSLYNGSVTPQIGAPANNSQRGVIFRTKQPLLIVGVGKYMPDVSTRTVTLFDIDTEDILEQTSVGGLANTFNYTSLSNYRWLAKGKQYSVQIFIPSGSYYQAAWTSVNPAIEPLGMLSCDGCDASTLPSTNTPGFAGGYADIMAYSRKDSISEPSYSLPSSLPTSLNLASSSVNPTAGSSITLTATLNNSDASGTVAFSVAGTAIPGCTAQAVTGGVALCTASITTNGPTSVQAEYSGANGYDSSTSAPVIITIAPAPIPPSTRAIPTLREYALIIMSLLVGGMAITNLRRKI